MNTIKLHNNITGSVQIERNRVLQLLGKSITVDWEIGTTSLVFERSVQKTDNSGKDVPESVGTGSQAFISSAQQERG